MNLYFCDRETPTRQWDIMLPGARRVIFDGTVFQGATDNLQITDGIIVVHRSYFGEENLLLLPGVLERTTLLAVVVISGDSQIVTATGGQPRLYYRISKVDISIDGSFKRCFELFLAGSKSADIGKLDFDTLEPIPCDVFALRILCEAYKLAPSGAGTKSYPAKAGELQKAISVYCPDPKEWFSIFGTTLPQKPEAGNGNDPRRFESELDVFANRMGDARDHAKELARAIATDDPRTGELILSFPGFTDKEQPADGQRGAQ